MERGNSDREAGAAWYLLEVASDFIWGGMSAYRRVDQGRRVGKDQTFILLGGVPQIVFP